METWTSNNHFLRIEKSTFKNRPFFLSTTCNFASASTSQVEGNIRDNLDAIDALIAGFPAGTVSGAPKIRAMELIDDLEPDRRGVYAGAIGYISVAGDLDTCIALRTAIIKNHTMHVQAGAGIVYDSDPEAEYEETQNKARALIRAAGEALRFTR